MITLGKHYRMGKKIFYSKVTQEYDPKYDSGHWRYCIFEVPYGGCQMEEGDLVSTGSSCCGAPTGKITYKNLDKFWKDFKFYYKLHKKAMKHWEKKYKKST